MDRAIFAFHSNCVVKSCEKLLCVFFFGVITICKISKNQKFKKKKYREK